MATFAFFGSSEFSIHVLEALKAHDLLPAFVVTTPDKPKGRGLVLSPTPVKEWARKKSIAVLDPAKLDNVFLEQLRQSVGKTHCELFVVASYGKIIPEAIINLPPRKTLNVHPSLLPKYRGASPIQSAMIDDAKETGVTIIELDREMDHGPIIAAKKIHFDEWSTYEKVEEKLGQAGGDLLAQIMPDWRSDALHEIAQNHSLATFTRKIVKEDGLVDSDDLSPLAPQERAYLAFRKIEAYHAWPGAYFFVEKRDPVTHESKKMRIKITSASWHSGKLSIEKVIPEGRKEMLYSDFLKG